MGRAMRGSSHQVWLRQAPPTSGCLGMLQTTVKQYYIKFEELRRKVLVHNKHYDEAFLCHQICEWTTMRHSKSHLTTWSANSRCRPRSG
jgi:hypothetical protein